MIAIAIDERADQLERAERGNGGGVTRPNSHGTRAQNHRKNRIVATRFDLFGLFLVEGVIEGEGMVFNVLGDTVDLVFGLMDFDLWIGCRNGIDLAVDFLLFEDGSFSDIDGEFGFTVAGVRRDDFLSELIFFDHEFEVDIDIFARGHVVGFFFLLFFFGLLHLDPTLFSFLFNFLDGFHEIVVF